ncbi:MAG: AAA family ATPase, partial [bacterium]|nr:AAA family ATPase [bacterium]
KPYSVILFDEVDKAHPDVFNVLLQILDDGRVTDSQGRTVDFKHTVIIMTSNIGSHYLLEGVTDQGEIPDDVRDSVMQALRSTFRPEFLNRVDEIVLFTTLTYEEIEQIVDLQIAALDRRLSDQNLKLELTVAARVFIAKSGYDPVFGARPLKRFIQRELETRLGRAIIGGDIFSGAIMTVDLKDGTLQVDYTNPVESESET